MELGGGLPGGFDHIGNSVQRLSSPAYNGFLCGLREVEGGDVSCFLFVGMV